MELEPVGTGGEGATGPGPGAPSPELREVVPVGPEGTLYVDLDFGSIRVEGHDEPVVAVEAVAEGATAHLASFQLDRDGDDVVLSGEVERLLGGVTGVRIRVRARVPRSFHIDASTGAGPVRLRRLGGRVAAESGAGPIEVRDVRGPVLARSGAGPIRIREVERELRAHTGAGPIGVRDVTGRVEARTLGGSIRVAEAAARVEARSAAGSITVAFRTAPEGVLVTNAGSIDVRVPREAGADLEARSSIGRVRIDRDLAFTGRRSSSAASGRLGDGGPGLELRSSIGGVSVRPSRSGRREPTGD